MAMGIEDFYSVQPGRNVKLPDICGQYAGKKLIVCADAMCIWNDLELFGCADRSQRGSVRKDGWQFMTINKMVELFPGRIEHAYSNEAEALVHFIAARRREYKPEFGNPNHTHACQRGVKWQWPWRGNGTSLLGACLAAVLMGYDQVVIAGGPLDNSPHNGEPSWRKCRFQFSEVADRGGKMNRYWEQARDECFGGKVKSLSGRTRQWLGAP